MMIWAVIPLVLLIGVLLWERWYVHKKAKKDVFTPVERELYLDRLRRKRSMEMKEREKDGK